MAHVVRQWLGVAFSLLFFALRAAVRCACLVLPQCGNFSADNPVLLASRATPGGRNGTICLALAARRADSNSAANLSVWRPALTKGLNAGPKPPRSLRRPLVVRMLDLFVGAF